MVNKGCNLPDEPCFDGKMLSTCHGAPQVGDSDICIICNEHADFEPEEEHTSDPTIDDIDYRKR